MKEAPVINLKVCTDCGSCLEVAPGIFARRTETGEITVLERDDYPDEDVHAAVAICPADCITPGGE